MFVSGDVTAGLDSAAGCTRASEVRPVVYSLVL
jgi:hypothetical protein